MIIINVKKVLQHTKCGAMHPFENKNYSEAQIFTIFELSFLIYDIIK